METERIALSARERDQWKVSRQASITLAELWVAAIRCDSIATRSQRHRGAIPATLRRQRGCMRRCAPSVIASWPHRPAATTRPKRFRLGCVRPRLQDRSERSRLVCVTRSGPRD
jgi:hypothetical protein